MKLSRDQWVLVITMACSECELCDGTGSIGRTHRRRGRGPRIRFVACFRCKNMRRLLEQLGVPSRRVEPESAALG